MKFNTFCSSHYNNNNNETSAFISAYSELFNDNFANINLSQYSKPFNNINLLPLFLKPSKLLSVSFVLPSVSPVDKTSDNNFMDIKLLLNLDNNITDIELPLTSELDGIDTSNIIEVWRIRLVGGLFYKENLVVLFNNGIHICTCMESIIKGIICQHFWRVMLYSSSARFHISIIPIRWYKDEILMKLDDILNDLPVFTALESSTETSTTSWTIDFTLQSLRQLQGSCHKENAQKIIPQRNRFGVAFSTAKTAINIALETESDNELVKLLKNFILNKQRSRDGNGVELENNVYVVVESNDQIISLQQNLIDQTTDSHVTKI